MAEAVSTGCSVGIVGATGVAGREIVRQLQVRGFPYRELRFFGSVRTAGARVEGDGPSAVVELLLDESGHGLDLVFLAAGPAVAAEWAPKLAERGACVIDLSSAFRDDPDVPLVVPEVNAATIGQRRRGILASPSPTTVALAALFGALARRWEVRRAVISSYQGVASAGTKAVRDLSRETLQLMNGTPRRRPASQRPLAFNCVPEVGALDVAGRSAHEGAVGRELERILGAQAPALHLTAVRIPMFMGLGLSVTMELAHPVTATEAARALTEAPGMVVHPAGVAPTPREVGGSTATHVGRIRVDPTTACGLGCWVAIDAITKGRVMNAVAIGETVARELLS